MRWDRIVEEKIRAAQEEGKFDDLPGKGQPLSLDENPFEDPAWQAANHLLKEQGFRPGWLEDDIELRGKLKKARTALRRSREWRTAELAALGDRDDVGARQKRAWIAGEWDRAVERFHESIVEINRGIANLNLKVPHTRFQRTKLVAEDELKKLVEE